ADRKVRDALQLTDEQRRQLDQVAFRQAEAWGNTLRQLKQLSREEFQTKLAQLAKAHEEAASQILQPRQTRRLEQTAFQIQAQAPTGFRDPRVVAALQLTAQQKEAIRKLQEEAWVGMGPFPPGPGPGPGPMPGPGFRRQPVFGRPEFS